MKYLAIERDVRTPRKPVSRRKRGEDALDPTDENSDARDVLVSAIPTEVLAPYTAIVSGIVATIDPGDSDRAVLRWFLYGIGIAMIVGYLASTYQRQKAANSRRFPVAEILASVFAFAAWGLVMPGSPLSLELQGDDMVIATLIITIGGAAVLGMFFGNQLRKKA